MPNERRPYGTLWGAMMNIKSFAPSVLLACTAIAPAQARKFIFHYDAYPNYSDPAGPVSATLSDHVGRAERGWRLRHIGGNRHD